jgi:hypothetical protein
MMTAATQGYGMGMGGMVQGTKEQQRLAYNEMTVTADGRVLTNSHKRSEREKLGYCQECQGMPILLYHVKKSRMNPLWVTKEPRAVAGECARGICFVCYPDKDPANKGKSRYSNLMSPVSQQGRRSATAIAIGQRPLPSVPTTAHRRDSAPPSSPVVSSRSRASPRPLTSPSPRPMTLPIPSPGPARSGFVTPGTGSSNNSRGSQHRTGSHSSRERDPLAHIPAPPIQAHIPAPPIQAHIPAPPIQAHIPAPPIQAHIPAPPIQDTSPAPEAADDDLPPARPSTDDPFPRQESNGSSNQRPRSDSLLSRESSVSSRRPSNDVSAAETTTSASTTDRASRAQEAVPEQDADAIISEVDSLVTALMEADGTAEILAQSLLGTMREHKSSEEVLIYCLTTIWESCKGNEDNKHQIMRLNGPEDIINAMKTFQNSPKLQEVGCGAIWALSISAEHRVNFIRLGACSIIMASIEKFMDIEDVLRPAVGAVRTLSPEQEARELLRVAEGSKFVALAMTTHPFSDSIQRDGCAFLSNSAVDIEKQFVHVVPQSELEAVVQAMENHKDDVSVMAGACFALKNYTFEENNCRRLRRIKSSGALLKYAAVLEASPECMQDAGDILESMEIAKSLDDSIEDQACMSILSTVESQIRCPDAPNTILEFMKENDWSPRLVATGFQMFRRIIVEETSHRDRLFDKGMIQQIVQFANSLMEEEFVCQEACSLFASLATEERRRSALTGAGVCDIIFHSLKSEKNVSLITSCLEALELLTSTNAGDCQSLARAHKGLIRGVVEANGTNEVIMMSGIGILSLVE